MKFCICLLMAAMISNIPHIVAAETLASNPDQMISTAIVVEEMSRAQTQQKIEQILSDQEVQNKLAAMGLSQDEISKRLATLSDAEMKQMAQQIDQARYGGDGVVGILLIVVLVLLILYLAKRI
ncbi:MAG: PA2779 family protein [Bdellovibrionales bacterium]